MPHPDLVVFSGASGAVERVGDHEELVEAHLVLRGRMYLEVDHPRLDAGVIEDVKRHLAEHLTREDRILVGDEERFKMLVHECARRAVEYDYDARLIEEMRQSGRLAQLFAEVKDAEPSDTPGFHLEGRCPSCALRECDGRLRFNLETGQWWCCREEIGDDAIDFYAVLHRIGRREARAQLALELGIRDWPFVLEAGPMSKVAA